MNTLDEQIAQQLREAELTGELRAAPSFGKPMPSIEGYDETPQELRLPFKILKDAGVVPPEVELMQQLGAMRQRLAACDDPAEQRSLRQRISDQQQLIALRVERLRATRTL
jgi:hypothetical protein